MKPRENFNLKEGIVAAKHGSSKPLTSNELWLLELRIKSTRILAPIPDALWDRRKLSIRKQYKARHIITNVGINYKAHSLGLGRNICFFFLFLFCFVFRS